MSKNIKRPSGSDPKTSGNGNIGRVYRKGYKPVNEGYKPITSEQSTSVPKAPKGGSGKS